MTQSYNLSQLANNLNTAGQLDATDGLVGAVPPANGGTGLASYAVGDLLYASGATAIAKLPDIATGNVLISGGVSAAPSYGKVGLTTHVNGTLGLANGGTNSTATPVAGSVIVGTGSAMAATAAGTAGQVLTSAGAGTPTWATASGSQTAATVFASAGAGQTFTIPAGVTKVKVTVVGGGAAGGASSNSGCNYFSGGGGGAGGAAIKWLTDLVPGGTLTVAVGAAAGTSSVASGTSNTITTVSATGGTAGGNASGSSTPGGAGGLGTNGNLNTRGGGGGIGAQNTGVANSGGSGGSSIMGGGGTNGSAGTYGGGGGGNLGAGSVGLVMFEY